MGFSVTDIILLIGMQGRTGELVLESGNNIGTMLFYEGKILQAFSPCSRSIGDLLLEDSVISERDLMDALELQKKNSYASLGSLLHQSGKVAFGVIEMMVQEQIRAAVKEFQSWNTLNFIFEDKDIKPSDRIHLTVHEFIKPESLKTAADFFSAEPQREESSSAGTYPPA